MKHAFCLLLLTAALVLSGCSKDRPLFGGDGPVIKGDRKVWDSNGELDSEEKRKIWENKEGEEVVK